jgi:hypothetical protein
VSDKPEKLKPIREVVATRTDGPNNQVVITFRGKNGRLYDLAIPQESVNALLGALFAHLTDLSLPEKGTTAVPLAGLRALRFQLLKAGPRIALQVHITPTAPLILEVQPEAEQSLAQVATEATQHLAKQTRH